MTRQARRLRGTLRPIARQDARERAYDAGRSPLGAPPWRFWAPGAALPSPWAPAVLQRRAGAFGSVQRAPRTQVVVPGGRGYEPPAAGRHSPLRANFSQAIETDNAFGGRARPSTPPSTLAFGQTGRSRP